MDITPLIRDGQNVIQGYGAGAFRINGAVFKTPVIVTSEKTWIWDAPMVAGDLSGGHFEPLLQIANDLDVVLLGTGGRMIQISPALKTTLKQEGLSVDAMDTGAACRTYNVLMAEGRRVAAALLPV